MQKEAAYWLALVYASGVKLSIVKSVAQQWYLIEGKPLVELFNLPVAEVGLHFGISDADAEKILKSAKAHAQQMSLLEQWSAQGISLLPLSHPHYPVGLLKKVPPKQQPLFLWAKGNTEILKHATVTILGNPNPDDATIAEVTTLVADLAQEDIGVLSGYGKGLDRNAFEAMLALEQGRGVAILPMGLHAFEKFSKNLDPFIDAGRALLLSPFPPDTAFKDSFAAARNMLVDSLAMVLLVPYADELAQNRAGAALERGVSVLVGKTDTPENRALLDAGAFLMTDTAEVVELVQQAVIDSEIQSQAIPPKVEKPIEKKITPPVELLNDTDDYKLHTDPVDALAADKAIEILSAAGELPNALRQRLMSLEKAAKSKQK